MYVTDPADTVYPVRRYGNTGYYWTATAQIPMQFLGPSPPLIERLDSGVSAGTQIAGRYVRRL